MGYNITEMFTDTQVVALLALIVSSSFVLISYIIHVMNQQYFDPVSGLMLVFFLSISGFLNGYAWITIGAGVSIIWLLIGLGLEIAKPVLIRGKYNTAYTRLVIILLQVVSIASATTVIHGKLNEDTKSYVTYQGKLLISKDDSVLDLLLEKKASIHLSKELESLSDSDLNMKISHYKTLQGNPTNKDKRRGYKKALLPETIWKLTRNCTKTDSPYYMQRNVCTNINWYSSELELRESLSKVNADIINLKVTKKSAKSSLVEDMPKQNSWMAMSNQILAMFMDDFVFIPSNESDIEKIKKQNQLSALLIALLMGILIEVVLHNISMKTFNDYNHKGNRQPLFEYAKQYIKKSLEPDVIKEHVKHVDSNLIPANLAIKENSKPVRKENTRLKSKSKKSVKLKDVIANLNETILLECYSRFTNESFQKGKGRYLEIALFLLHSGYVEGAYVWSQRVVLENYRDAKGVGVQYPEISAAVSLLMPIFIDVEGRRKVWKPKSEVSKNLSSVGLNVT